MCHSNKEANKNNNGWKFVNTLDMRCMWVNDEVYVG